jgi:hypothetical protein
MSGYQGGMKGKLKISGAFQFKDKDGKVLSEMRIVNGEIPLDRFTPEEQTQLIKELGHGTDHR